MSKKMKNAVFLSLIIALLLVVVFAFSAASRREENLLDGYEEVIVIWSGDHKPDDALKAEIEKHGREFIFNRERDRLIEAGMDKEALLEWEIQWKKQWE